MTSRFALACLTAVLVLSGCGDGGGATGGSGPVAAPVSGIDISAVGRACRSAVAEASDTATSQVYARSAASGADGLVRVAVQAGRGSWQCDATPRGQVQAVVQTG